MHRKYLEDIGHESYVDETVNNEKDDRHADFMREIDIYGFSGAETWSLDAVMNEYLYERLKEYLKEASETIDLEYYNFEFEGKKYTQKGIIEEMIARLQWVLGDIRKIPTGSEAYESFKNNPYYKKYEEFDDWNDEHLKVLDGVWEMWALVHRAMWW